MGIEEEATAIKIEEEETMEEAEIMDVEIGEIIKMSEEVMTRKIEVEAEVEVEATVVVVLADDFIAAI